MNPDRLLLISYAFPPAGGVAVQRALNFAKYLPGHGFQVHVLSARNATVPTRDPGLLRQLPPEVRLYRSLTPEPPFAAGKMLWSLAGGGRGRRGGSPATGGESRGPSIKQRVKRLLMPDPQVLWVPFALRRAAKLIERHGIGTVMVTAPPFSSFLIGIALKKRFPGLFLASDFRDEWLRFYLEDFDFFRDAAIREKAEQIQRETVEASDLVLAVTGSSLGEIRKRYPEQPDSKFAVVTNGYDPEVFRNFRPRPHGTGRMVVAFTGTAYKTSSARYYLDAVDGLPEEVRLDIETRFAGRVAETEGGVFEGRESRVRVYGFLAHEEMLRLLEESDYLMVTMTNDFMLPAKLFEYLATGKPILALSFPNGEIARLLEETNAGKCADPYDGEAVRAMVLGAWERWRCGQVGGEPRWEKIRRFERPRLTAELAGLLRDRRRPATRGYQIRDS